MTNDNNITNTDTKRLENAIDQLNDEYQSDLLCVLEVLNFAQNAREMPVEETEKANSGSRYAKRARRSRVK